VTVREGGREIVTVREAGRERGRYRVHPHVPSAKTPNRPLWHALDSQGQILALAFKSKSFKYFKLFSLDSEAEEYEALSGESAVNL
jgi:hypothetical protein